MSMASVQKNLNQAKTDIIEDSFKIQRRIGFDDLLDELLDRINEVRIRFAEMSGRLLSIVGSLEKLTWLVDAPSEGILKEINAILDISRGLHTQMEKSKVALKKIGIEELCPEAADVLFADIDLLGETIDDVEAVFFRLPNNPHFKEICKKAAQL